MGLQPTAGWGRLDLVVDRGRPRVASRGGSRRRVCRWCGWRERPAPRGSDCPRKVEAGATDGEEG
eukprot:1533029-Lingulodinium_polyedra.AAC.1